MIKKGFGTKLTFLNRFMVCLLLLSGIIFVTSCDMQEVASVKQETFFVDILFEGGTGKAFIRSPVEVTKNAEGMTARFVWSSKNYDYMIVDGVKYENENTGGDSTFSVPIDSINGTLSVIGDTVAMSIPHEIEYLITWGEISETGIKTDPGPEEETDRKTDLRTDNAADRASVVKALEEAGLKKTEDLPLKYASCFEIEKYGDYSLISIENSGEYLVIPENGDIPEGLPEGVVILKKPLDKTYLVSTSAMDLVSACGALDRITLSGTKENDWYVDEAKEAMERGDIVYAGRYRAPDYELILKKGCDLAIENTMIYHEPAVKEKLNELGIPVLVERSSYEEHPLGRLEWIRLYGVLFDREDEADAFFEKQLKIAEPIISGNEETGKTVAFFHVTANGLINVRRSGDYTAKMIGLAGGEYIPEETGDGENALSSMNMQMEDFYARALNADIIIYNSTIGGEIGSIDELIGKNALFADFKAVKEGNVYCTERSLFQQITKMALFMQDLNDVLHGRDREYTYLIKLE